MTSITIPHHRQRFPVNCYDWYRMGEREAVPQSPFIFRPNDNHDSRIILLWKNSTYIYIFPFQTIEFVRGNKSHAATAKIRSLLRMVVFQVRRIFAWSLSNFIDILQSRLKSLQSTSHNVILMHMLTCPFCVSPNVCCLSLIDFRYFNALKLREQQRMSSKAVIKFPSTL